MEGQRKLKAISRAANDYVGPGGFWMKAKFSGGRCKVCKSRIEKREWIWFDTLSSRCLCEDCRRVEDPNDQVPSKANNSKSARVSRASTSSVLSQEQKMPRLIKKTAAGVERRLQVKDKIPQSLSASKGKYVGFFDGACEKNPGRMGIGAILLRDAVRVDSISMNCGNGTNNVAE